MIKKLILWLTAVFLMFSIPLISVTSEELTETAHGAGEQETKKPESAVKAEASPVGDFSSGGKSGSEVNNKKPSGFRIRDVSTGETIVVDEWEFCRGALAYEMMPGFEEEALKAQAVALYTHFCRLREKNRDKEEDITADLSKGEIYLTEDILREKWGKDYEKNQKKTAAAVKSVQGLVIKGSDGSLIDAAYHAISPGNTENSRDIFGFDSENLRSAASPWDEAAPGFLTKTEVSGEEFRKKTGGEEIRIKKRTAAGTVLSAVVGNKEYTGAELRKLFSLRSAAFEVSRRDNKYIFTVRGYGHGVGLSQYGANGMAKDGADYKEILCHYYGKINIGTL